MMKFILTLLHSAAVSLLFAQATFIITSLPDYTPDEDIIYIAGSFNGWNPGDVNYVLHKNDSDQWEITTDGFPDETTIEYKFTRGDWATVEKGPDGEEIGNRLFTYGCFNRMY